MEKKLIWMEQNLPLSQPPATALAAFAFLQKMQCLPAIHFLTTPKSRLPFPTATARIMQTPIQKIKPLLKPGMTIYPGHGESFVLDEPFLQQFGI